MSPKEERKIVNSALECLKKHGRRTLLQICDYLGIEELHDVSNYLPVQLALIKPEKEGKIGYSHLDSSYFLSK